MATATSAAVADEEKRSRGDAPPSIDALPAEILDHIIGLCAKTPEEQRELRLVSRRWCEHVDSRLWDSVTELRLANSRASGAFVERLCRLVQQPEKIVLERCSKVALTNLEPLWLEPEKAIHVKELRIENCNKIASKDISLAKIIAACPNLEKLTFISCNVSQEQRFAGIQRRKMGEELITALERHRRDAPPLRLLKTNVLLPTKEFLQSSARFVERLELEELPCALGRDYFAQGVLCFGSAEYDARLGIDDSAHLGWAIPSSIEDADAIEQGGEQKRVYRSPGSLQLLGGEEIYQLQYWESYRASPVTLEQKQLLCLSRDGSASLLDGQGNVTEDTPIDARLRLHLHDLLDRGEEVWLSFLHVPDYPTILFSTSAGSGRAN